MHSQGIREQVLIWLKANVPASRVNHILRVEQMAVDLAVYYNQDARKAALAGLMHDLAKYFPPPILLEMARSEGIEVDSVMVANPRLLHADVGAVVAKDTFAVEDEEVLQAIANHTLGRPNMSRLSCIVFLADSLEPGRGDTPALHFLRQISFESIYKAVHLTCDYTLKNLLETPCLIHPRLVLTRNQFLLMSKSEAST